MRYLYIGIAVIATAAIGWILIASGNASTYAANSEAEAGTVNGRASKVTSNGASANQAVIFGTSAATPRLGALDATASNGSLYGAGFRQTVVAVAWRQIEPANDAFSASAITEAQTKINDANAAGLKVSLDIGVQYAPDWIFSAGGGTRFKNQHGNEFTGSPDSGNYVPNAVTNDNVRQEMAEYIQYLGSHLTGLDTVRLGGAAYNELRYPGGWQGTQPNSYWFYDESSQARLPASVRGWKPGTGTTAQAQAFIEAYHEAMAGFGVWLAQTGQSSFPAAVKLEMLLPGWGVRPGQVSTAVSNLLNSTPDEVNQGLDWPRLLPRLPANGRVIAYSTYADATQGGATNPNPAEYIHSILPTGMLQGGESTGNGQTTEAGMNLMFKYARQWNWYSVNWFFHGQPQTLQQISNAFSSQ